MKNIKELENLNYINYGNPLGLGKKWVFNKNDFHKKWDFIQKINYSISDINDLILNIDDFNANKIICLIVFIDWIKDGVSQVFSCLKEEIRDKFIYDREDELIKYKKYFKALRSLVVAHPLNTNLHKDFNLDGDIICIDIRDYKDILNINDIDRHYYFNVNAMIESEKDCDFYLYAYSNKKDNMKFFIKIGCDYNDIMNVARIFLDKLKKLDIYLRKTKIKEFDEK